MHPQPHDVSQPLLALYKGGKRPLSGVRSCLLHLKDLHLWVQSPSRCSPGQPLPHGLHNHTLDDRACCGRRHSPHRPRRPASPSNSHANQVNSTTSSSLRSCLGSLLGPLVAFPIVCLYTVSAAQHSDSPTAAYMSVSVPRCVPPLPPLLSADCVLASGNLEAASEPGRFKNIS